MLYFVNIEALSYYRRVPVCTIICIFAADLTTKSQRRPQSFLYLFIISKMIDKTIVIDTVKEAINGTDMFLVDVTVDNSNSIIVTLDSYEGMDVDTCADIARKIESRLDRDTEDYDLEVGSAGLTTPFKVKEQYLKNIGNEVEVLTRDGRKLHGILDEAGDTSFTIFTKVKEKVEGKKRPVEVDKQVVIDYDNAKSVKYVITF